MNFFNHFKMLLLTLLMLNWSETFGINNAQVNVDYNAQLATITLPDVIITEVYGGGGNSGAMYANDFFELYNTTESSVEISGWSIQYYAAAGTGQASNVITIPAGKSIPAKGYFLIQGSGGSTGDVLPPPDVTGTVNAASSAGKVILYSTDVAQTISSSDLSTITGNVYFKDYVPYGTTAVPVFGSAMSSAASNTVSATRKMVEGEYIYTQDIGVDFETKAPSPQNSLSTSVNQPLNIIKISAFNGKIRFFARSGEVAIVYDSVGNQLVSKVTNDGLNTIPVNVKGMIIVIIGNRIAKLIL